MFFKNWWQSRQKKKQQRPANNHFSSEKVYTPVSQLELGMYIVELDRPWLETPFLFQGFELKNQSDIQSVKNVCSYVYVDMTRKKNIQNPIVNNSQTNTPTILNHGFTPKKLGSFEQEISRAEKAYGNTEVLIADFMQKAARGVEIDGWLAKKAVAECVNSVLHSPDAMLWLTQLKNKHEYTVQHSLNVCVLSIVLGRHINLPEKNLNILGLCGMMHDIGKMLIPFEILNKQGALEEEEMHIMQSHTTLGYELLKSTNHIHSSASETALSHHERLDGAGYPRQIKQSAISDFTKIVTISDVYDSITSNRSYQSGKNHLEATQIMIKTAGTHLDRNLIIKFIESIGVYPPGCLVIMTNGAIAIVVEVNEKLKLRPKIIIILDEDKNPAPEKIIDLSEMVTDKRGVLYTIKSVTRAEDWNIDCRKYYEQGILQKSFAMQKEIIK
ncbi:MAG: HD-GYP domain-containing protein [Methylovulum sp.]